MALSHKLTPLEKIDRHMVNIRLSQKENLAKYTAARKLEERKKLWEQIRLRQIALEEKKLKEEEEREKKQAQISRSNQEASRKLLIEATAYISSCKGCSGWTYTEYDVRNTSTYKGLRIIATDHSVIPLYSIVRIETKNETFDAIVLDKGGGIKNNELDLLVDSYDEAIMFGRQVVTVTVLREGVGK